MRSLLTTVVLLFTAIAISAQASMATLNVQGILRDNSGAALEDGAYEVTFSIYDQETGGTFLWKETQNIQLSNGVFNSVLGADANNAFGLPFDKVYWVGVSVGGANEYDPRIRLTSAPYALSLIGTSNKFPSAGKVEIGTTSSNSDLDVNGDLNVSGGTILEGTLSVEGDATVVNVDASSLTGDIFKGGQYKTTAGGSIMEIRRYNVDGIRFANVAGERLGTYYSGRDYYNLWLGVYREDCSIAVAGYNLIINEKYRDDPRERSMLPVTRSINGKNEWGVQIHYGRPVALDWGPGAQVSYGFTLDVLFITKGIVNDFR